MESNAVKRVAALYRVSTKKQVDKQMGGDIPMQKIACREFANEKGWVIAFEFYEKGVSGFKVSANDRDKIQDLKELALNKEFDVLLVYMFDRIGRIDSETPFVVEWFIQHGIEVWSTQEGEQKLNDQVDKLMNYIRFWQANGESQKTSMRLKTKMAQLTADGIFHGGREPFGYQLVNNGRINKKGQPVKDLVIHEAESEIVRTVFYKTIQEGYGSHRLAEFLNEMGVRTHNGTKFNSNSILRILRNRICCGYLVAGDTVSKKIPELAIVEENVFETANEILKQRSVKYEEKKHFAQQTRGKTLLSGNIFCGHCGCSLNASKRTEKRIRKDGTLYQKETLRYMCYHKARRLNNCDGQSVYLAAKVDNMVLEVVKNYLKQITTTPKDKALELRYKNEMKQKKQQIKKLDDEKLRLEKRLQELSVEISKSLTGESIFTVDVLSMSVNNVKEELENVEKRLTDSKEELNEKNEIFNKLDYFYEQFVDWADEFDHVSLEKKKMIICQLIKSIKIRKGYEIDIEFNISYQQFLSAC